MIGARLQAASSRLLGYPPQLLLQGEGSNGGTSIVDSSGNALSVTNNGVTTSTSQFKKGATSLAFGTSGYLNTANSAHLQISQSIDWTIDMYVYVTSIVDGAYSCLFFNTAGGAGGWASTHNLALYMSAAGKLYLEYRNTNGSTTALTIVDFGTAIPLNAWMHLALTYDTATNTMKSWQNGTLDTTNVLTGWAAANTSPLVILGRIDLTTVSLTRPYGGFMDQVRLTPAKRWTTNFTPD